MNEAGTGAYSCAEAVPSTAAEFGRWVRDYQGWWPSHLYLKAERALLSLRAMESGAAHQSEVTDAMNKRDLQAFVEAYEAWKSDAPPWTEEQLKKADLYEGDKLIRRGANSV
jgi:hypothetical protein